MNKLARFLLILFFSLHMSQWVVAQASGVAPILCDSCDPPPPPPSCTSPNPIDDATFFVQQQYRDFLFRNPTGAELANDVAPLNSCLLQGDFACYNTERIHMSRNMWDKPEFRQQSRTFGLPLIDKPYQLFDHGDFVELSYNIYLQRASSDPPDDSSRSGWVFWKTKLDNCVDDAYSNNGNIPQCYIDNVNAFLSSTEYRARFGCP